MTRVERIGDATLYLGDCREVLPTLGRIDAVVTDPPYGVRDDDWDDMEPHELGRFSAAWMAPCASLAKEMIVFGNVDNAVHLLAKMMFPRVRVMFWHKPPGSQLSGSSERGRWFAHEAIFHCFDGLSGVVSGRTSRLPGLIRQARIAAGMSLGAVDIACRGKKTGLCYRWEEGACIPTKAQIEVLSKVLQLPDDFTRALEEAEGQRIEVTADRSDVLSYRTVINGDHPTQKPTSLLIELLQDTGREYASILDPFMGSGTTGVACARLGRHFIGVEKESKYYEIALRRIEQAHRQKDLFVESRHDVPCAEQLIMEGLS